MSAPARAEERRAAAASGFHHHRAERFLFRLVCVVAHFNTQRKAPGKLKRLREIWARDRLAVYGWGYKIEWRRDENVPKFEGRYRW